MKINELLLPDELAFDLKTGGRKLSNDELFRLRELLDRVESPLPKFYNYAEIEDANQLWNSESAKYYVGQRIESVAPGDVDPQRTLIIGQAEPDSPIALDYRTQSPRVVYLGDVQHQTVWIQLSADYSSLMQMLQRGTI